MRRKIFGVLFSALSLLGTDSLFYGNAHGQGEPTFDVPDYIRFKPGAPFRGAGYSTSYEGRLRNPNAGGSIGGGTLGYDYLNKKYHYQLKLGVAYAFQSGEKVGLLGGVYLVSANDDRASLQRIPDEKLPKGLKAPQSDSFTIPLQRSENTWANICKVQVVILEIKRPKADDGKPTASIRVSGVPFSVAEVKEGDIVLLGDRCFTVRGVVPYDRKTQIAGWVEFAPQPILEADLIRDKKAYVRPMPKADEKK